MKMVWVGFFVLTVITSISYEILQKNLPKITYYKEKNNLLYHHRSIFDWLIFIYCFHKVVSA